MNSQASNDLLTDEQVKAGLRAMGLDPSKVAEIEIVDNGLGFRVRMVRYRRPTPEEAS